MHISVLSVPKNSPTTNISFMSPIPKYSLFLLPNFLNKNTKRPSKITKIRPDIRLLAHFDKESQTLSPTNPKAEKRTYVPEIKSHKTHPIIGIAFGIFRDFKSV